MQSSEKGTKLDAFLATVQRFVREELLPAEAQVEKDDDIPPGIVNKLKQLGFFGMTIPEHYGGLGLSMFDEAQVVFEIGYASPVEDCECVWGEGGLSTSIEIGGNALASFTQNSGCAQTR